MKRVLIFLSVIAIAGLALFVASFAHTQRAFTEELKVGETVIKISDMETLYGVGNVCADIFGTEPYSMEDVHNILVTRALVEPLFEQYQIELPPETEEEIRTSYTAFEELYQTAVEEGNHGQVAGLQDAKNIIERLVEGSGLSKEEYYQWATDYNIYQYKLMLLEKEFGGNTDAMMDAANKALEQQGYSLEVEIYEFKN